VTTEYIAQMATAVIGSVAGGLLVWAAISPGAGMLRMFGIGAGAAVVAVLAQRGLGRLAPVRS
jgi:hypothetical protein